MPKARPDSLMKVLEQTEHVISLIAGTNFVGVLHAHSFIHKEIFILFMEILVKLVESTYGSNTGGGQTSSLVATYSWG